MQTFFLDLWHDIREKHLLPVVVLLVCAIAAVPFVMLDKAEPAPPAPAPTATQGQAAADKLPTVALDDVAARAPSNLAEFAKTQRNPFKPLKDLPKADDTNVTVDRGGDAAASDSGSSGSSSGSGSGSKPAASGGGTGSGAGGAVGPKTTYFTYRADIRFGSPGKEKTMKQVAQFSLLGDEKEPAAVFMGISDDAKHAVFLVDTARFETNGEHECKPAEDRCEFVWLSLDEDGNETTFTTLDGTKTYNVELLAIKRIVLDTKDVESVPVEDDSAEKEAGSVADVGDLVPRSLFDIVSQKR